MSNPPRAYVKTKTLPKESGGTCMHDHVVPDGLVVGEAIGVALGLCAITMCWRQGRHIQRSSAVTRLWSRMVTEAVIAHTDDVVRSWCLSTT
jgi:hypothetical protein